MKPEQAQEIVNAIKAYIKAEIADSQSDPGDSCGYGSQIYSAEAYLLQTLIEAD